jgi:hypothetical protein
MTNDDEVRGRPERDQADDAEGRRGDPDPHDRSSDPAGAVSNQNGEEAESGLRADGTHPEPRTDDQPDEPERSSS